MRTRHSRLVLVSALACVLAYAACSGASRYATLSFFFDGVPDPSKPPPPSPSQPAYKLGPLSAEEKAAIFRRLFKPFEIYYHKPWKDDDCQGCHSLMPQRKQGGWRAGLPKLIAPLEELCLRCHEVPKQKFVHGPVAAGACRVCHFPHKSSYPHLLVEKDVNSLCLSCHSGDKLVSAKQHEEYGDRRCTECHDPHSAPLPFLQRAADKSSSDYAPHLRDQGATTAPGPRNGK